MKTHRCYSVNDEVLSFYYNLLGFQSHNYVSPKFVYDFKELMPTEIRHQYPKSSCKLNEALLALIESIYNSYDESAFKQNAYFMAIKEIITTILNLNIMPFSDSDYLKHFSRVNVIITLAIKAILTLGVDKTIIYAQWLKERNYDKLLIPDENLQEFAFLILLSLLGNADTPDYNIFIGDTEEINECHLFQMVVELFDEEKDAINEDSKKIPSWSYKKVSNSSNLDAYLKNKTNSDLYKTYIKAKYDDLLDISKSEIKFLMQPCSRISYSLARRLTVKK